MIVVKIVGIDLAGKPINPTGICILQNTQKEFKTVYSDQQILKIILETKPDIIAIDAPLMEGEPRVRKADILLKKYKAFPPTFSGMKPLTIRGSHLADQLRPCCRVIEVFPTATAKILGVHYGNYKETAEALHIEVKNKHELDAYLCCLTAELFLSGNAIEIGDEDGKIVIPKLRDDT